MVRKSEGMTDGKTEDVLEEDGERESTGRQWRGSKLR